MYYIHITFPEDNMIVLLSLVQQLHHQFGSARAWFRTDTIGLTVHNQPSKGEIKFLESLVANKFCLSYHVTEAY